MRDVSPEHLSDLNLGRAEARTLTEALVIDHRLLLAAVVPDAPGALVDAVDTAQQLGILKRMTEIGASLHRYLPANELGLLATHTSDTVRGWWCFATASDSRHGAARLLEVCAARADDSCFTVREWVWMAVRPRLVRNLSGSIDLLVPWTRNESAYLRRFASECLRPRGVWAGHIAALKQDPALGEPILEPLRSDPSRYVQDSVANWINDAAKTSPDWALELTARWRSESPTPQTERIIGRALRSIA